MWVHATLVDTSMQVYAAYVGTLSQAEKLRYYEEQKRLGEMFGVPVDRAARDARATSTSTSSG